MSKKYGTLTFVQKDENSMFIYSYEISNFHAAKILEYLGGVADKKPAQFRDRKGRFYKPMLRKLAESSK